VCFDVLDSEILPRGLFELRDLVVETVVVEQFENAAFFLLSIARPLDGSPMAIIGQRDGLEPSIDSKGFNAAWLRGYFLCGCGRCGDDGVSNEVSSRDSHDRLLRKRKPLFQYLLLLLI
jgi:hypothetical protein